MSSNASIPVASVVSVTVQGAGVNLAQPNINTLALISSETPVNSSLVSSYGLYQNAAQVGTDWGTSSKAFAIASAIFAQNPSILSTQGYLVIIPRVVGTQAFLAVQDITYYAVAPGTGGNSITITYTTGATAGKEVVTVASNAISVQIATGVSTAAQVLAAIAASPQASALVYGLITGTASAAQVSAVSSNLATGSGTGLETIIGAITRTMNTVFYYGLLIDTDLHSTASVFSQLAAFVQGLTKVFFYASSTAADIYTSGILQASTAAGNTRTRGLYYSDGTQNDTYAFAGAYAGLALSTNFNAPGGTQTMNLKTLASITPDATVSSNLALLSVAMTNGVDTYPAIGSPNNGRVQSSGANSFFDQVYGQDWFTLAVQTALFNALANVSGKVPQTELGMTFLKNVVSNICQMAVSNGWVAPGSWTAAIPFGNPADFARCIGDFGFYIYSLPVSQQVTTQRTARIAPTIQVGLKMAGAVHFVVLNALINL